MRSPIGMSLIEMLTTIFIMSFVAAAMSEIAVTQNVVAYRTYNKIEGLVAARRLSSSLQREIHSARFIGDQFGSISGSNNGPNSFPSASNPDYSPTAGPPGFLGYPTTWAAPRYFLNAQTLIIQTPVLTNDGYPTKRGSNYWNVDTIVYRLIADQQNTGRFLLQKAIFPGDHSIPGYADAPAGSSKDPQTVVAGIVGPNDLAVGVPFPKIFSYYNRASQTFMQAPPIETDAPSINGVAINIEILGDSASKRLDVIPKTIAFRSEIFTRANYMSTP